MNRWFGFIPLTTQRAAAWHGRGPVAVSRTCRRDRSCVGCVLCRPSLPAAARITTGDGWPCAVDRRTPVGVEDAGQPDSLLHALPGDGRGTDRGPPHHQPNSRWQWVPETRVPDGFYPIRRRVWNEFSIRGYIIGQNLVPVGYGGYGCGCILPIPAYPRVRNTRTKK